MTAQQSAPGDPICLVENHTGQGLAVRQDALQVLANITQPVVVVAITALCRSGKSYLMNRLAGRRTGEGKGGEGGGWTLCAPMLGFLSSVDQWLTSTVLVWGCRDAELSRPAPGAGRQQRAELWLFCPAGSSPEAERYDLLRECIRQFFPQRRCFVFNLPASVRDLQHLEELPEHRMEPEFLRQLEKFCCYIWESSRAKSIPGGCKVTGKMLGTLAVTYVDAIQSGAVPCLESAVTALAELHNSAAVREAAVLYQELMEQRAELPTETAEELLELHEQCQRETLQLFAERAITADVERFRLQVEAARLQFCSRNEEASREKCTAALQELRSEMEQRIGDGVYFVPGGHRLFLGDQQALVERYRALPGKGVKADAVLQEFLRNVEPLARSICSTDRALMEKDERIKRN
uniref:GB1/RHD3-type G domain-containing protein n=1 Tax=Phasianus colchicus TaxID=9054 RepID=A0A669QFK8_PHACC